MDELNVAQCDHYDDDMQRCPARAKYDVTSLHPYREWMACERHALACEREGCEVDRPEPLEVE